MAKLVSRYDSSDFSTTRYQSIQGLATTAETQFFQFFTRARLRGVHALVQVAGTTTGGAAGYTLRHVAAGTATTSFGQLTSGTNAAGNLQNGTFTRTFVSGDSISFLKGADATLIATLSVEWAMLPDAVIS